jgi:MFS family permease
MLRTNARLFTTLGACIVLVGAARAARQTVLPLWAAHLQLSAAHISLIFGIASAFDVALFYPAGKVMDRFGRLSVIVPSLTLLGGAMICLPLTHDALSFAIVACVMSTGNGIGSGIVMTLGSDVAPTESRTRFLSIWRLCNDTGNAGGPLVVSAVATVASLAAGIVTIGWVGVLAAGLLLRSVPRYTPLATRTGMLRYRAQQSLVAAAAQSRPD